MKLTRAERRCLRLAYEGSKRMPSDDISASMNTSRESTLESLRAKGLLLRSAHRGTTYHLTTEAIELAKRAAEPAYG